jgi:hypothetical protein
VAPPPPHPSWGGTHTQFVERDVEASEECDLRHDRIDGAANAGVGRVVDA